jgi:importin subunit beta-1
MQISLQLLNTVGGKSSVPDIVFTAIGALANALESDFFPYMEAFAPYLYKGLENQEEASLCSMSIGLVSDITRALGERIQPWCDDFMNRLLADLQSQSLGHQFKPAILQCFGDIAQAIGGHFETYFPVVTQVLQQAGIVDAGQDSPYELQEYVVSLREGIMDAWDGAIVAMTVGGKPQLISTHLTDIFTLIHKIHDDHNRSEALLRSSMGVIG